MSNARQELIKLLDVNDTILDNQPSDELYEEWVQLRGATLTVVDGFIAVMNAAKAVRDAQNAFFKARKAGLRSDKLLEESRDLERELDKLLKYWQHQMLPPADQMTLF
jgi:NH3-dependent NAD+ synthetase